MVSSALVQYSHLAKKKKNRHYLEPNTNTQSNYKATITQARPDVIDRPSDSRVRGQRSAGSRFSFSLTLVCVCVCTLFFFSSFFRPLEEEDADS